MRHNSFQKIYASYIAPNPEMDVLWMDLTQNTDEEIDSRIFVKEKIMLDSERLEDYKEVNEIPVIENEQIL